MKSTANSNQTADRKPGTARNINNGTETVAVSENVFRELETLAVETRRNIPCDLVDDVIMLGIEEARNVKNAGKGAAIAKSPVPASNVPPEKETPPASPEIALSESDKKTLRRAFHLLFAKRRTSINSEEDTIFKDNENKKSKGILTKEDCDECLAEYGRLKQETVILSMLEKGLSPYFVLDAQILTNGQTKPEWESYLCLLGELYSMFATPKELEA